MNREISLYYDMVRLKNERIRAERKQKVYDDLPELKEIDLKIKENALNIAISAFELDTDSEEVFKKLKKEIQSLQVRRAVLLTDNDYEIDYLDSVYTCNLCKDRGYVDKKACKCYKQKKFELGSRLSNLHHLMQFENFENFDYKLFPDEELEDEHFLKTENITNLRDYMHSVVHFLKLFVTDKNLGVYLYGNTGVGKTFLCSSICKYAVEKGLFVNYYSMRSLVEILDNHTFNNDTKFSKAEEDTYKKAYQDLTKCDILILDDLGTELRNKNTISELFYIINERMAKNKKTIISSNISLEDISEVYEERIASRILGNYIHFPIVGYDLRQV